MEVKQISTLLNSVLKEVLGKDNVVSEDLTGLVATGDEVFNANAVDKYVKSLVNQIGRVIFVTRKYNGSAPSVLMDGWEYGSVCEKISGELLEATENESWELVDGTSYDPNVFYQPKVSAKFYNKLVTFDIPCSFTEKQVKQSFTSAEQMNGFLSMIYNEIDKTMTVNLDNLVMRTINNFIGETIYSEYSDASYTTKSGVRAVNLLYLYNNANGTSLTTAQAINNPDFIKYATYQMSLYIDRLTKISTLFNIGGKSKFTPKEMLHFVMLNDFAKASDIYLQSGTYHKELVELKGYETVPYFQASGKKYAFDDVSKINIKTSDGHTVTISGVLGVMFDRDALGVCNKDRRVTTNYNAKAEFYTNWYKFDAEYFNDLNENGVVFFIQ